MTVITDLHTHHAGRRDAILSVAPDEALRLHATPADQPYSIALHPWWVDAALRASFADAVAACRGDERLRAVGECGLDPAGAADVGVQQAAFAEALAAARACGLPTVVHCVRWWDAMARTVQTVWGPRGAEAAWEAACPIVVHGFRKGPDLARQLLRWGFGISLGEHFNQAVPPLVPVGKLFVETDESTVPIAQIRENVYLCGGRFPESENITA